MPALETDRFIIMSRLPSMAFRMSHDFHSTARYVTFYLRLLNSTKIGVPAKALWLPGSISPGKCARFGRALLSRKAAALESG